MEVSRGKVTRGSGVYGASVTRSEVHCTYVGMARAMPPGGPGARSEVHIHLTPSPCTCDPVDPTFWVVGDQTGHICDDLIFSLAIVTLFHRSPRPYRYRFHRKSDHPTTKATPTKSSIKRFRVVRIHGLPRISRACSWVTIEQIYLQIAR